jgi:hypothetical protein
MNLKSNEYCFFIFKFNLDDRFQYIAQRFEIVEQKLDALSTNVKKAIIDSPDQVLQENNIVFQVKTLEDLEKVEELCKNITINLAIKKEFMAYKPRLTHVK